MVNVGLSPGSLLGIVIAVAGAALYFLRSMRPELARDHDIFFAAVGLLCGGILFFQGWRLDPILLFGQILLTGSSIFFAFESIRLRGVATDQARRSTPIVDEDRPVGRVYRAELDELAPIDDVPPVRRIRSARDAASRSRTAYVDELEGEARSVRRSKRPPTSRPTGERPPRRRPRPPESSDFGMEETQTPPERRSRPSRPPVDSTAPSSRPPKRRPRPEPPISSTSGDYVDYQPLDFSDDSDHESDNSANFDDE